ncbi:hypothetical protein IEO21_06876 [Rhodonia placenta]|uniref:Major facilitator superfamily (MFS) profile domain-containing protein n=1 Tax=Rhodonia placenta TaxID=104341 RepID=A0A8H7U0A9_9APHY|nr:hypothetical protein IEO21_06876 [Postia placenta]
MADVEKSTEISACESVNDELSETLCNAEADSDGGWHGWLSVFGAFLALYCTFGQLNAFGTFQTWYGDHQLRHLAPSTISWIGSLQLWVFFFSGGIIGRIFDARGPRMLMLCGSAILVASIMLTSISTRFWHYILCQGILFGLGVGLVFYPSVAVVSTRFKRYRATALGIAMAGSGSGGVVYPIMFRRLFDQVGFPWAVRISGFVCLALCGIALATVTMPLPLRRTRRPWFELETLKDRRFILLLIASVFIAFGLFIPNFYIVDYAVAHGISPTTAFYVLAIMNAGSVPGRLLPPFASDTLGRFNLMVPCVFLAGLLVLLLWTLAKNLAAIIMFSLLFGFCSGGFNALIISCVAQISEDSQIGTRVGILYTVISFPSLGGGPAAGALLSYSHGSYIGTIVLSGSTILVGSLLMLCARLKIDGRWIARV